MKEWFTPAQLAAFRLPFMPNTSRAVQHLAEREGWRKPDLEWPGNDRGVWRKRAGRGGGFEYRAAVLNSQARAALERKLAKDAAPAKPEQDFKSDLVRSSVWQVYEQSNDRLKAQAKKRLDALVAAERLVEGGSERLVAMMVAAREFGVSERTLWQWRERCYGKPREDWLAHLVPSYAGRRAEASCCPDAWEFIKTLYLHPECPPFTDCYRRLAAVAKERGWTIPSEKTLKRRIDALPEAVKIAGRKGSEALKRLYPAQERDKTALLPMEAVNADGHKFDNLVLWPGEKKPIRPVLLAFQDIYSGMIVSWRLDRSENAQAVLLAFGDMVETWGIPEHVLFDNGRNFSSKWITGGVANRYRFKVREGDPEGVLRLLDCQLHWATPYHGQAKPIERAFRDLASSIARDPRLAGSWTGNTIANKPENYGSKPAPLDVFERVLAEGIAEHNSRVGRRSKVADGRSLEQTFMDAYPQAMVRRITPEQKRLWLLAAESVSVRKPNAEIHFLGNRYWHDALLDHIGSKVVVRFDPDALHDGVHVYQKNGVYICEAECLHAEGFFDVAAARKHAAQRKTWLRAQKDMLAAERGMTLKEVAEALDSVSKHEPQELPEQKIIRPMFRRGGAAAAVAYAEQEENTTDTLVAFARGLEVIKQKGSEDE